MIEGVTILLIGLAVGLSAGLVIGVAAARVDWSKPPPPPLTPRQIAQERYARMSRYSWAFMTPESQARKAKVFHEAFGPFDK